MNNSAGKFLNHVSSLPLSKKISMALVLILVIAGFVFMFVWANQIDYRILFSNLSPEDAGAIVSELKDRKVPHKLEGNGSVIMVPADQVMDLRLSLAGQNLPNGGSVGFEIFDKMDFRTTKFVQELNYRRALQGELARTINNFKEVRGSRVFIVLPRESLFVEESTSASASIQLDLRENLPPNKLAAIVHLVASAAEGLEPGKVTVVDTQGTVIFKGGNKNATEAPLSNAQLDYKRKVENRIRENVQSMLEGIAGHGKAIVRVNAEIDFNKVSMSEEEYDPYTTVVRSKRNVLEYTNKGQKVPDAPKKDTQTLIDQRRGVLPSSHENQGNQRKEHITTNYEINKITRNILQPAGSIKRLSVAAVIDGTYKVEQLADGTTKSIYIPRDAQELRKLEDLVKKAMGYSLDREDQVSVSSIPFTKASSLSPARETEPGGRVSEFLKLLQAYKRPLVNLLLAAAAFFFVVRPLISSLKKMAKETVAERRELQGTRQEYEQLEQGREPNQKERVLELSRSDPEKTQKLIRGWIGE
ncbi:MAG: flagellar basal-body MS-ring/collar protein FliF [Thermodesulfobacteriota bacterium]